MKSILLVFGLGLAGIDPWGAALLLAALAAGARKPHVLAFSLATFIGTVALGVAFSVFGKLVIDQIVAFIPDINDPIWAFVEIIVAALIAYWVISQLTGQTTTDAPVQTKPPPRISVFGMVLSGMAFSAVTIVDPTFFATAAIASQATALPSMIGLHSIWVLTSQSLLFALSAACMFDIHQPLVDLAKPMWEKVKRPAMWLLMGGLVVVAIGLTVDAIALFTTGAYLVPL